MQITAPEGTDMTGKKVVVVFSSLQHSAPNEWVPDATEPELQAMCVFDLLPDDVFPGEAKPTCKNEYNITTNITDKTTITLDKDKISLATAKLPNDATAKYARFYVRHNGEIVNLKYNPSLLTISGVEPEVPIRPIYGYYLYNNGNDLDLSNISVTLNVDEGTLLEYEVVCLLSTDIAKEVSENKVTAEPDWDVVFTYRFMEAVTLWTTESNVEWSSQSMQIAASDIVTGKGEGYLESKKASHTLLRWYVVDDDGMQNLQLGSSRVDDIWSINVSSNPFEVVDNYATVSNSGDLGLDAWNKWAAPQFYAPKNVTFTQLAAKHTRFVCEFYENDDASYSELQSIAYTVYIDRTEPMGQLKDGGLYGEELVQDITHEMTEHTFPLRNAIIAYHENFNNKPVTYIRIYLTKNDGTELDPTTGTEQLEVKEATNTGHPFVNNKTYGYYFQNEDGIAISDAKAHVTLPAGMFTYYNVVVAMSGDKGETEHTSGLENISQRAAVINNPYEPDYDYIYTFKFAETSSFPGALIESFIPHSKEVLVKTTDKKATIPLSDYVDEFVSDLEETSFEDMVKNYFHVRWFVAKKNPDGTYEKLPNSEDMFPNEELDTEHWDEVNQGIYWNSSLTNDTDKKQILDVIFKKPDGGNWSDYQVVVWMTNDATGAVSTGTTLSKAPQNIKIQYIFNFFEEENWKFVHYKGASGRDYFTVNAEAPNYRDSRIDAVGSPLTQYDWDNATSTAFATSDDIRQSVHTVEYELYVGDGEVNLKLPFEEGDNLEPTAYIRWYDYTTDLNTSMLNPESNQLRRFEETLAAESKQDRGWFYLTTNQTNFSSASFGMKFKGGLLNENETAVIACDVSKYYDGSYQTTSDGSLTFLHEPTLSIRYIYTIRRAKVCADNIKEKADIFEDACKRLTNGNVKYSEIKDDMFNLFEDNGRTVVSLNGVEGLFSLRASLSDLSYYHIYGTDGLVECGGIDWYAYYEDEEGLWRCNDAIKENSSRICNARYTDFVNSTYYLLSDNSKSKTLSATTAKGTRFHLIGCLKKQWSYDIKAAAIHYELCFIDAPAIPVLDLRNADDTKDDYDFYLKRTRDYLDANLTPAGAVTFDDKFLKEDGSINYDKPTTWEENIREMPLEWNEAEYSFCYPSIDAYRQNNGWTGFAPQHGDYILLKSMNLPNVSVNDDGATRRWYFGKSPTLRDYTYTYKHGYSEADSDYGGFFYVDASDEARTVANLKFSASLCRGSEIHFTMAVANATETIGSIDKHVPPQLVAHVYEMTDDGKKGQLVISFIACTLFDDIIKGKNELAKWYQYYGYGVIPSTIKLDGSSKDFIVEVDNNSSHTDGADFCVDEIRFYTKTTKLIVEQGIYDCNAEEEPPTNLYINVEDMQSFMAIANNPEEDGKTIYWRICDKDHKPVPENEAGTLYENDKKNFGKTKMPNDIPDVSTLPYDHPKGEWGFFRKDEDGKDVVYFSLAYKRLNLEDGKRYYISVYNLGETQEPADDDDLWGIYTNACDVYSEFFLPRKMYVTVTNGEGEDNSEVTLGCGVFSAMVNINVVLHVPDNTQASGFKSYTDFKFDFFLGTLEEFNRYSTNATIEGETKTITLLDAIKDFRKNHKGTYKTLPIEYDQNGNYRKLIEDVLGTKLFLLDEGSIGDLKVTADNKTILAIPTQWYVTVTDKNGNPRPKKDGLDGEYETVDICDPFEFVFTVTSGEGDGPELTLGFEGVDYEDKGIRVVRVGLEQIKNMQSNGYLLHIPVNKFKKDENAETEDGTLKIVSDYLELWSDSQTDDSKVTQKMNVATFMNDGEISKTKMYVSVNFHGEGIDTQTFYEGFTYHMFFQVQDKDAGAGACTGEVHFLMKVVPEYVTWNDVATDDRAVTPNANENTNWNNDKNWSRSRKAELHKTAEHNSDNYQDNGTGSGDNGVTSTPAAFVPMKFTYVTIPSGNRAPNLIGLTRGSDDIYNNIGNDATDNIQYDLMVMVDEENQCTHGGGTNVYDCEKFYGNWAKEIYFKPRAELVNQQYLTYGKAWVEKELVANKWYLMSTPLKETYAGDMYVPYGNGRQETEAFKAIEFDTETYSRTKYPIYQRSWLQEGSMVYTMTTDVRATSYSAALKGSITQELCLWSHAYNDVTEKYSQWTGFAIRAHKQAQDNLALIRLPKEDTNYDYYKWDGNVPEDGQVKQKVDKSATGRLFTDGAEDGTVQIPVGTVQTAHDYLLVGNPYVCSVDMAKFLKVNESILENKYWTYEHNTVANPYTTGTVKPLQAFFVKVKDSDIDGDTPITFTQAMMMDGNTNPIAASARAMTMTASNDRGQSSATVSVGEEAKSVETLFDSNMADVPMVYTVADGQAVSVNQVTEAGRPIAFGVTCDGSEPVTVTFSDIEQLTSGEVYVVDAVTGEQTAVDEGCTLSIQPNDYGRYFLLTRALGSDEQVDVQKGIVISVRGREVTVASGEALTLVRALSPDGTTVHQDAGGGTTASFVLASGVYVVKAENAAGDQQTVKIVVK